MQMCTRPCGVPGTYVSLPDATCCSGCSKCSIWVSLSRRELIPENISEKKGIAKRVR